MAIAAKKPAAKTISTKDVVPAKKGFPAKKTGTAAKKAPSKKPKPLVFKAPVDFKPFFLEVAVQTGTDGLFSPVGFSATRIRGNWDNPEAKRYDLATYDVPTLAAIGMRLSSVTFAPNILKRLPINTKFKLILRVSKKAATGGLMASVKFLAMSNEAGKMKWIKDVKDPTRRRIRRANRVLASAFLAVQLPPSARKVKKGESEE
jgi:hypothetical protein